ncbi:MAG: maleylpyruvate isomerase N-terminal domain-containing protein [Actinomycetes bacterium]
MDEIDRIVAGIRQSQEKLVAALAGLTDAQARQPSLLPGWSVGHLLTHVARNADSVVRRFEGALRDEVVDQYVGGQAGRDAEIEAGAGRSAAELVDDVRQTSAAVDEICARMPPDAWARMTRSVTGNETAASHVALSRWREVEVHHVDLGLGYTTADWSAELVQTCLPGVLQTLARRTDSAALMAWAMNRGPAPDVAAWG